MREIKFRGKRLSDGEWVKGYLFTYEGRAWIFSEIYMIAVEAVYGKEFDEVQPATVGQYTGLKDKKGNEICEGDIVKYHPEANAGIGRVVYEGSGFYVTDEFNGLLDDFATMGIEVIGNIHDNPEMMEEGNT